MADGAEVHVLYPGREKADEDAPIHPQERGKFCAHRHTRLDDAAHRVYCRDCNAEVDPFKVLADLAFEWSRWVDARKEAERLAKRAKERLDEVLRLERNAKSRIRTLKKDPRSGL